MSIQSNAGLSANNIFRRISNLFYCTCSKVFPPLIFQLRRDNICSFRNLLQYTLLNIPQIVQRIFCPEQSYPIEDQIVSPSTRIIFTHSKLTNAHICMKGWQRTKNGDSKPADITKHIDNLLEGLEFNQRFAPGVYLGIARIRGLNEDAQTILRDRLIFKPKKGDVKPEEYVVVMRYLEKDWRLDQRLYAKRDGLSTEGDMEFLAKEVARMHGQMKPSPRDMGLPQNIAAKLDFNIYRFEEALQKLAAQDIDVSRYSWIIDLMTTAITKYESLFEHRHRQGHIKRCHGDLKTTNLWIYPDSKKFSSQLFALDCIDFNPDFCHIDTLSDVAMLAVDIQMLFMKKAGKFAVEHFENDLSEYFLNCYLAEMQENTEIAWRLLEYYLTEKSLVCAYVSILFDNMIERGRNYLDIALMHALRLKKQLKMFEYASIPR